MSSEVSNANTPTESFVTEENGLVAKRYVRIPAKNRQKVPMVVIGCGAYSMGLGFLWIVGSVLFSGLLAVFGTGMIVAGMHADDKAKNGW